MDENVAAVFDPEKDYELVIHRWEIAVESDWTTEARIQGEYQQVAGRKIFLEEGDRLRKGPTAFMQGAINQGFIREVISNGDHQ